MDENERFFYEHAGWGYDPNTETPEQGRERGAIELARAERVGASLGWSYFTAYDYDDCADPDDDGGTRSKLDAGSLVRLVVYVETDTSEIVGSVGSVIVESDADPYVRVVAAEIMSDALATHTSIHDNGAYEVVSDAAYFAGRVVTCGACERSWLDVPTAVTPAPAARCPFENEHDEADDGDSYRVSVLCDVRAAGPAPDEEWYRLQVSGDHTGHHLNITAHELDALIRLVRGWDS